MKLNDCITYVEDKARELGYTERMIACFRCDIADLVTQLDDWSTVELDEIVDKVF